MNLQNDLILRTVRGETTERTPVWLMRQAGRILPEYRALRASVADFKGLVETPALAAEATVQPIDALGVDAAILFSDILVVPEAMGLPYEMLERRGPLFPKTISGEGDLKQLRTPQDAADALEYVYGAIHATLQRLNGRVPLIGFAGAPWTIFAYMVEGQGSKTFSKAKALLYKEPALSHQLLQHITDTTILYLRKQVEAGVHMLQVFDSWAGILGPEQYRAFSTRYLKQIADAIPEVPMTLFAKGAWFALEDFGQLAYRTIGLDWTQDPAQARQALQSNQILQGNLDPCQLYAQPDAIVEATHTMLTQFGKGHIANLGHGVYPDTPLEGVRAFVDTILKYRLPLSFS